MNLRDANNGDKYKLSLAGRGWINGIALQLGELGWSSTSSTSGDLPDYSSESASTIDPEQHTDHTDHTDAEAAADAAAGPSRSMDSRSVGNSDQPVFRVRTKMADLSQSDCGCCRLTTSEAFSAAANALSGSLRSVTSSRQPAQTSASTQAVSYDQGRQSRQEAKARGMQEHLRKKSKELADATCCRRLWILRWELLQLWLVRTIYEHLWCGVWTRFRYDLARFVRLGQLVGALTISMLVTAVFFSLTGVNNGPTDPPMDGSDVPPPPGDGTVSGVVTASDGSTANATFVDTSEPMTQLQSIGISVVASLF